MTENQTTYDDEISLRELILKLRYFISEVFRHWYIPAVCIALALAYQGYKYVTFTPVYPAKITFSVDEEEVGSAPGLTGILGQFGLGSVRPSRYNLDKILALSKSRRVVEAGLFTRKTINGKEDFLANHLIREYSISHPMHPESVFLLTHDSLARFNQDENEMLLMLYRFIVGSPEDPKHALLAADYNEDTNIMSMEVSTSNETLSIEMTLSLFDNLSNYYINKAVEKQLKTLSVIEMKRDSVLSVLKSTEYQLANFSDSHQGLRMRTDQLSELRLRREIAALSAMYAEVLKNTEVADFSLKNKMPFIQIIDAPLSPIYPTQLSLLRKLLIGIILGGAIGSVFVIGRSILRDVMGDTAT